MQTIKKPKISSMPKAKKVRAPKAVPAFKMSMKTSEPGRSMRKKKSV